MDTAIMKSLLKRATARPFPFIGLIIAVITLLFVFWWLLSPKNKSSITEPNTAIIANQKISAPVPQPAEVSTSVPITPSAIEGTTPQVSTPPLTTSVTTTTPVITTTAATTSKPAVNIALPTDPATAAEELDHLKDDQSRVK
jgi:cytoskeletal protein RodZ